MEARLERFGNQIGGDRLAEARRALEQGDYSIADDLFAEIEERRRLEVEEAARAAFGRGEIAEAEVRWADASRHYARAVDLQEEPEFDTLFKARELAWLAGEFDSALLFGHRLIELARTLSEPEKLSRALNEHALTLEGQGRYAEAETLLRQALEICEQTLAVDHPHTQLVRKNVESLRSQKPG
ncbi:tetratricopeptide repeat protein [Lutimaribacter marinistellae]|uniref:Tetratricopeptide repeat protein n=1 Tax=Lutimaribacter marinistellae TaxID=1820329 RepID=A0ABV7TI44_9RHOB